MDGQPDDNKVIGQVVEDDSDDGWGWLIELGNWTCERPAWLRDGLWVEITVRPYFRP